MNIVNAIVVLFCATVFSFSFLLGDEKALFFNLIALVVVITGTAGATFLSYPYERIKAAFIVALNSYATTPPTPDAVVQSLLDLSVKSKFDGILSLEKFEGQSSVTFMRNALGMLVDGYKEDDLRETLMNEMYYFKQRRVLNERVFVHMSRLAPAFGIAGSVLGLIGMLGGIGDTGVILKTIPIALTSTLYGIVLSNFVLIPIAESINMKTHSELLLQRLIVDGVTAIRGEQNTRMLEKKLLSFLTPSARRQHRGSLGEITKKYSRMVAEKKARKV